jgi:hypothetical protein
VREERAEVLRERAQYQPLEPPHAGLAAQPTARAKMSPEQLRCSRERRLWEALRQRLRRDDGAARSGRLKGLQQQQQELFSDAAPRATSGMAAAISCGRPGGTANRSSEQAAPGTD